MIVVRFKRSWMMYQPGETAGFDAVQAQRLIASGHAVSKADHDAAVARVEREAKAEAKAKAEAEAKAKAEADARAKAETEAKAEAEAKAKADAKASK